MVLFEFFDTVENALGDIAVALYEIRDNRDAVIKQLKEGLPTQPCEKSQMIAKLERVITSMECDNFPIAQTRQKIAVPLSVLCSVTSGTRYLNYRDEFMSQIEEMSNVCAHLPNSSSPIMPDDMNLTKIDFAHFSNGECNPMCYPKLSLYEDKSLRIANQAAKFMLFNNILVEDIIKYISSVKALTERITNFIAFCSSILSTLECARGNLDKVSETNDNEKFSILYSCFCNDIYSKFVSRAIDEIPYLNNGIIITRAMRGNMTYVSKAITLCQVPNHSIL